MSEENQLPNNSEQPIEETQVETQSYLYQWKAQPESSCNRQQKAYKGVLIYAAVLSTVFLLCIVALIGTLIWNASGGDRMNGIMTTKEIAQNVSPATVLVVAYDETTHRSGTGFFVSSDGYIVTNYHVLKGYSSFRVTLYSGEELAARLISYREIEDVAVLKVAGGNYPAVSIGDSDAISVGDVAIAIGNPSGADAPWTTTQGIISYVGRMVELDGEDYAAEIVMLQTDAAVNSGNSGGPLCNDRGEVIGMITYKMTDQNGEEMEAIGLALPINGVMEIADAIMENGTAEKVETGFSRIRPKLGIEGIVVTKGARYTFNEREYTAEVDGILISSIASKSLAQGTLFEGDVILSVDGVQIVGHDDLKELLFQYEKGDRVPVTVWRNGKSVTVTLTLGMQ